MPTTRTRRARPTRLLPEHAAWAHSDDAARFFENVASYPTYYDGEIQSLPGVRPWWPELRRVWHSRNVDFNPPNDGRLHYDLDSWAKAREFVMALYEEYKTSPKR
jgi:hypothetical protein